MEFVTGLIIVKKHFKRCLFNCNLTKTPPTNLFSENQQGTACDVTLNVDTDYYWKVVSTDDHGKTSEGSVWSFKTTDQVWECGDDITYDGKSYGTVEIGTQCWMDKNLNIGTRIDGSQDQTDNELIEKYCYDDSEGQCNSFGGLYQWDELMAFNTGESTQGICTVGWHIPSHPEWTALVTYLGGTGVAGGKMKEVGGA